ncbi:hypothetical protein BD324DRAFT_683876 [Kockovaella imperatae]|uniref:Extracellular membrane protein CFEM domain-containing protein n=1 Tax=Kockovaella imperatae TaxID=4999 RepID=A0A1Y1U7M8_9TREE|nr:hypothetical protein BD324DRAFT_683876 [Kockovaella imperatae]ORX34039.1 hypothetical protein BD324DRAFT_683876 [Kockovaella imperatae]
MHFSALFTVLATGASLSAAHQGHAISQLLKRDIPGLPDSCKDRCNEINPVYDACMNADVEVCITICNADVFPKYQDCLQCIVDLVPEDQEAQLQPSIDQVDQLCANINPDAGSASGTSSESAAAESSSAAENGTASGAASSTSSTPLASQAASAASSKVASITSGAASKSSSGTLGSAASSVQSAVSTSGSASAAVGAPNLIGGFVALLGAGIGATLLI